MLKIINVKIYDLENQLALLRLKYGNIDVIVHTSKPGEPDLYQSIEQIEVEDFSDDITVVILKLSQD